MGSSVFVFCGNASIFHKRKRGCHIGEIRQIQGDAQKKWGKMMCVLKIITTFANEQLILIT